MVEPVAAVIFDLDGVLVESEPWWAAARQVVAARLGGTWTPEDEASVKGYNTREWTATLRARLGPEVPAEQLERDVVALVVDRYRRAGAPRIDAGVAAVRRLGARYPLAVASSAHPDVIAVALEALGSADRFTAVVSADEVAAGKPAPDVYLEAARRLGIAPEACLVVEDSRSGVRAAHSAGMRVVWVGVEADERTARALGATAALPSLDALDDEALDRISGSG